MQKKRNPACQPFRQQEGDIDNVFAEQEQSVSIIVNLCPQNSPVVETYPRNMFQIRKRERKKKERTAQTIYVDRRKNSSSHAMPL
jgi:hypothetical protein